MIAIDAIAANPWMLLTIIGAGLILISAGLRIGAFIIDQRLGSQHALHKFVARCAIIASIIGGTIMMIILLRQIITALNLPA